MKLLEQVRQVARVKHLAYRTEQAYAMRLVGAVTPAGSGLVSHRLPRVRSAIRG